MTPRKLDVMFVSFAYGGNGGIRSEVPDIREWFVETVLKAKQDERVGKIHHITIAETPVTLARNHAVELAKVRKADVLIMLDSDMRPDCEVGGDPFAKPFWDTTFDFMYSHWDKGPTVVGAPYCGQSPVNNVFVFQFASDRNGAHDQDHKVSQYTREQACTMAGIQQAAALPTGVIAFDMRIFDVVDPPYFDYEWTDKYQHEKASTEDVMATRDMALMGVAKLGYNPVYCNWDAWAGHWKPELVRKPRPLTTEQISKKYVEAIQKNRSAYDQRVYIGDEESYKGPPQEVRDYWEGKKQPSEPETGPAYFDFSSKELVRTEVDKGQDGALAMGTLTDRQTLRDLVQEHFAGRSVHDANAVELGSFIGESSVCIADELPPGGLLWCVDTWQGTPTDRTQEIIRAYGGSQAIYERFLQTIGDRRNVETVRLDTVSAAQKFEDGTVDILFVDAGHSYREVMADLNAWLPKMKPDGLVIGHDYNDYFPGVKQASHEVFGNVSHRSNIWWAPVPANVAIAAAAGSGDVPPGVEEYWTKVLGMPFSEYAAKYPEREVATNGHA